MLVHCAVCMNEEPRVPVLICAVTKLLTLCIAKLVCCCLYKHLCFLTWNHSVLLHLTHPQAIRYILVLLLSRNILFILYWS